jgi:hypothetical protein
MSPVKDIHLMSDEEIVKLVGEAHNHVKQVHNIDKDHAEFDKFLAMHPYYADAVAEYKRRNLGETLKKGDVISIPSINLVNPKSSSSVEIPQKSEEAQNPIPEGSGQEVPLIPPEGKLPSEEVPAHKLEEAIKKEEPNITDEQLKEEVKLRKEETKS